MSTPPIYIDALSLIAPDVGQAAPLAEVFRSGRFGTYPDGWKASPESIPPRARRRHSPQTLLAILAAERIAPALEPDAAWVFGSAFGEGETLQVILDALCTPTMAIRPTRFQNSVHNAASGQWTIAQGIGTAATSICGADHTVGASLLKALLQVWLEQRPVGVVLFDAPLPFPLNTSHRITCAGAAGLALSARRGPRSVASVEFALDTAPVSPPQTSFSEQAIAKLNPVFAVLPLFERLTGFGDQDIVLGMNGGQGLRLKVTGL